MAETEVDVEVDVDAGEDLDFGVEEEEESATVETESTGTVETKDEANEGYIQCPAPYCTGKGGFHNISHLRAHWRRVHLPVRLRIFCPFNGCNLQFETYRNVARHMSDRHNHCFDKRPQALFYLLEFPHIAEYVSTPHFSDPGDSWSEVVKAVPIKPHPLLEKSLPKTAKNHGIVKRRFLWFQKQNKTEIMLSTCEIYYSKLLYIKKIIGDGHHEFFNDEEKELALEAIHTQIAKPKYLNTGYKLMNKMFQLAVVGWFGRDSESLSNVCQPQTSPPAQNQSADTQRGSSQMSALQKYWSTKVKPHVEKCQPPSSNFDSCHVPAFYSGISKDAQTPESSTSMNYYDPEGYQDVDHQQRNKCAVQDEEGQNEDSEHRYSEIHDDVIAPSSINPIKWQTADAVPIRGIEMYHTSENKSSSSGTNQKGILGQYTSKHGDLHTGQADQDNENSMGVLGEYYSGDLEGISPEDAVNEQLNWLCKFNQGMRNRMSRKKERSSWSREENNEYSIEQQGMFGQYGSDYSDQHISQAGFTQGCDRSSLLGNYESDVQGGYPQDAGFGRHNRFNRDINRGNFEPYASDQGQSRNPPPNRQAGLLGKYKGKLQGARPQDIANQQMAWLGRFSQGVVERCEKKKEKREQERLVLLHNQGRGRGWIQAPESHRPRNQDRGFGRGNRGDFGGNRGYQSNRSRRGRGYYSNRGEQGYY